MIERHLEPTNMRSTLHKRVCWSAVWCLLGGLTIATLDLRREMAAIRKEVLMVTRTLKLPVAATRQAKLETRTLKHLAAATRKAKLETKRQRALVVKAPAVHRKSK